MTRISPLTRPAAAPCQLQWSLGTVLRWAVEGVSTEREVLAYLFNSEKPMNRNHGSGSSKLNYNASSAGRVGLSLHRPRVKRKHSTP